MAPEPSKRHARARLGYIKDVEPFTLYWIIRKVSALEKFFAEEDKAYAVSLIVAYNFRQLGLEANVQKGTVNNVPHAWIVSGNIIWDCLPISDNEPKRKLFSDHKEYLPNVPAEKPTEALLAENFGKNQLQLFKSYLTLFKLPA